MNKNNYIITGLLISVVLLPILILIIYLIPHNSKIDNLIKNGKEIEKKWLIEEKDIPYDLTKADKFEIEQTYICYEPEIRIRRFNNGEYFTLTLKANMSTDGLIRDEIEYYITEETYNQLLSKKEGFTIHKTRYQLLSNDLLIEIDIFKDELYGLAYMEIEFEDEEQANKISDPDWIIKDVTSDKRYKNQSLSQFGIPQND